GVGYDADGNSTEQYKKLWPADLHVIGKDIIRFHTIYWPIFLMALGEPLPKTVFGHAWILQNGWKMSKSKGNVMYADDLVEIFGVDAVRYYSLVCMPYENDGNLTLEMMTEKINADLANVYGNLVKRTIAMSQKYFGGVVENAGVNEEVDEDLKNQVLSAYKNFALNMDEYRVADAIEGLISVLRRANKYIDETAPWILAKDEAKSGRLKTVLYNLTEALVIITSLLEPIIPATAERVLKQLNSQRRAYSDMDKFGLYKNGEKVTDNAEIIFNRLDIEEIYKKAAEIEDRNAPAHAKEEEKIEKLPEITIDDFMKVQLKVALVTACERIEKSKKLLKLSLKIGDETRTVASGIAEYYKPEELVGKKVIIVYNLKPARLCGVESQGMILCAEKDGVVKIVESELPDGATVR
ncbi:MAG: methionine--tRNA ligase subunit beta, partial [Clostridia bacterium]|nr:methionine--tRNA ligase subunit beta [Clostridia bacterium]